MTFVNYGIMIALCLQYTTFSILRSEMPDTTCNSTVLFYSELFKLAFSLAMVYLQNTWSDLFRKLYIILIPALVFLLMNLINFWTITQIPASLYVIMMQFKLPWTLILSMIFLHATYTKHHIIFILFICVSCANIVLINNNENVLKYAGLLPTVAMVTETFLSALMGVYLEKMFENSAQTMWIRNVELSILSLPIYGSITYMKNCSFIPSQLGITFAMLCSLGGILVAFSIVYSGALTKTVVTSSSIILVTICESIIHNIVPGIQQLSFYFIGLFSIIFYNIQPKNKNIILQDESLGLLKKKIR